MNFADAIRELAERLRNAVDTLRKSHEDLDHLFPAAAGYERILGHTQERPPRETLLKDQVVFSVKGGLYPSCPGIVTMENSSARILKR
ncbi:MAG: hypothetical protein IPJ06_14880 [Saprospiraceae bacterium]|nr:hypothetical protein [Saprospiraceae bacterium]